MGGGVLLGGGVLPFLLARSPQTTRGSFSIVEPLGRLGHPSARPPTATATYLRFTEGGGYVRREWWNDEGWAWKEQYDITRPTGWSAVRTPDSPAGPLQPPPPTGSAPAGSWFEADAFARVHEQRADAASSGEVADLGPESTSC